MKWPRVVGLAAASGKIGYAYLEDGRPVDWGLSRMASQTPELAAAKAGYWLSLHRPEVVVTEKLDERSRKHGKTIALIRAFAKEAKVARAVHIEVPRPRDFKNKYEEAEALAEQFPELKPWLRDQPPCWKNEPLNLIMFEALALALSAKLTEEE